MWWAFSQRRPGSATLLGVAFAYGAPIGTIVGRLTAYLLVGSAGMEVAVAATLICLVAWLGTGAWALHSPSFCRWLPTGDAPRWMRLRMLAGAAIAPATQPQPAAVSITYDIRCHELDGSVEQALDRALQAGGHRRADSASPYRQILVLSNLTPIDGLDQTLAELGARAVVVISAPVSLVALDDVERYQWVDHRRRNRRRSRRVGLGAEVVPESLDRRVVPLGVLARASSASSPRHRTWGSADGRRGAKARAGKHVVAGGRSTARRQGARASAVPRAWAAGSRARAADTAPSPGPRSAAPDRS